MVICCWVSGLALIARMMTSLPLPDMKMQNLPGMISILRYAQYQSIRVARFTESSSLFLSWGDMLNLIFHSKLVQTLEAREPHQGGFEKGVPSLSVKDRMLCYWTLVLTITSCAQDFCKRRYSLKIKQKHMSCIRASTRHWSLWGILSGRQDSSVNKTFRSVFLQTSAAVADERTGSHGSAGIGPSSQDAAVLDNLSQQLTTLPRGRWVLCAVLSEREPALFIDLCAQEPSLWAKTPRRESIFDSAHANIKFEADFSCLISSDWLNWRRVYVIPCTLLAICN